METIETFLAKAWQGLGGHTSDAWTVVFDYEALLGNPHKKKSGVFYTPKSMVQYMVAETVGKLLRICNI
jgi:hypothetical protein